VNGSGSALAERHGIHGTIPADLAEVPSGAEQFSPLVPGSPSLEVVAERGLASMIVLAPPGTLERRYVLALSLKALRIGGTLVALAPRNRGGTRLHGELAEFGVAATETARAHYRICACVRPERLEGIADAIAAGGPRFVEATGLWSQPGIFSWDRIDAGSRLLAAHLPEFEGCGADFGCGVGILARTVLQSRRVTALGLVDIDHRAIDAAKRNIADSRASFQWADATATATTGLDFVVTNPPFHEGGGENRALGLTVARAASASLRKGGELWLVANRHLAYAPVLRDAFTSADTVVEDRDFRVFRAIK